MSSCSQRRWSDPGSWPSGALPEEGEDVIISSRWRMLMDVTPPPLREVFVLGELMFEDQRDYNFTANLVGVRVCGVCVWDVVYDSYICVCMCGVCVWCVCGVHMWGGSVCGGVYDEPIVSTTYGYLLSILSSSDHCPSISIPFSPPSPVTFNLTTDPHPGSKCTSHHRHRDLPLYPSCCPHPHREEKQR